MVAGDHLHGDPRPLAPIHGGHGLGTRRIHHPLNSQKRELFRDMGVLEPVMVRLHPAAREAEHPQCPRRHRFGGIEHSVLVEFNDRTIVVKRVGTSF